MFEKQEENILSLKEEAQANEKSLRLIMNLNELFLVAPIYRCTYNFMAEHGMAKRTWPKILNCTVEWILQGVC